MSIAGSQTSLSAQNKINFRGSKSTLYPTGSRKNLATDERSQRSNPQKAAVQVLKCYYNNNIM